MADPWAVVSTRPISGKTDAADPWAVKSVTPVRKRSMVDNVTGYVTGVMANVNRGTGLLDEAAAKVDSMVTLGGDFLSGRRRLDPKNLRGSLKAAEREAFDASMAKQRGVEDSFREAYPKTAAFAQGFGNALPVFIPAGETTNAFAQAPRAMNMVRGAVTAGLTSAGYAAADRGTPRERLKAASDASWNPMTLALGAAGGALAPACKGAPKQRISQDVIDLRAKNVELTPGQARGGFVRAVEDAATSTPILGTEIQNARRAGVESFNRANANDALAPVGLKVPDEIPAGRDMVAHVEKTLGGLYDTTIPGRSIAADAEFKAAVGTRIGDIAQDMTEDGRRRLAGILDQRVTGRFGKVKIDPTDMSPTIPGSGSGMVEGISGETFQRINSELGAVKGRFSASQDADQRAIAEALGVMQEELRNAAARQDPAFAARKAAIDSGWSAFKRIQGAAASPGAEGGVYTAAQYGGALRRGDRSVDKGATARGSVRGQGFADAARAVLPSKVPDSGTATRGMIGSLVSAPAAVSAGFATGGVPGGLSVAAGYGATMGGLKLASKAYSPQAIKAANAALDVRISKQQQSAAVNELRRLAMTDPSVARLYQEVSARISRAAGVTAQENAFARPAPPAR